LTGIQALLALHTAIGAVWKFSHSPEQTMTSLKAIPPGLWLAMSVLELLCSVGLLLPAVSQPLAILAPIAAACVAVEVLGFSGLHLFSGSEGYGAVMYWMVVAALCAFVAYGRLALRPA